MASSSKQKHARSAKRKAGLELRPAIPSPWRTAPELPVPRSCEGGGGRRRLRNALLHGRRRGVLESWSRGRQRLSRPRFVSLKDPSSSERAITAIASQPLGRSPLSIRAPFSFVPAFRWTAEVRTHLSGLARERLESETRACETAELSRDGGSRGEAGNNPRRVRVKAAPPRARRRGVAQGRFPSSSQRTCTRSPEARNAPAELRWRKRASRVPRSDEFGCEEQPVRESGNGYRSVAGNRASQARRRSSGLKNRPSVPLQLLGARAEERTHARQPTRSAQGEVPLRTREGSEENLVI